jgi:hypothetical protein
MAEENNQENQKTIVSFIVGLLIGGLLVWAFSGPSTEAPTETMTDEETSEMESSDDVSSDDAEPEETADTPTTPQLQVGDGQISVADQPAGISVELIEAEYPVAEGWIGVRTYEDEQLTNILGVNRFSASQGLVPESIQLVTPTVPGVTYAIVVYEEDGDFDFSLSGDRQLDTIFDTFTAQ